MILLLSVIFLPYQIPRARADSAIFLSIFAEDYNSPNIIDPSLIPGTNFIVDVQASGLPAIVDQASGGLEGFDVSLSYNSSILKADHMGTISPLCPSKEGCIFDTPINNTLTYQNSTNILAGTARLAMIGLGANHRANNSTGPGLPSILLRVQFLVVGKGVTPVTISPSSELIGYSGSSCSLLTYQLTGASNGSFDNRPPFTLSATPSSLTIPAGSSGSTRVVVNATNPSIPTNATLQLSGLNSTSGGTFSFSPPFAVLDSTNPSFTSTLGISIHGTPKPGTYPLEIIAVNSFIPFDPFEQFRLPFNLTILGSTVYPYVSTSSSPIQVSSVPSIPPSLPTSTSAPPVIATFTFTQSPAVGTSVKFAPTVWCGTSPYNYRWSFGDGTVSTNSTASHKYSSPGNYNVTLTITDQSGQRFVSSQIVRVAQAQAPPLPPDTRGLLTGVILVLFLLLATSFVLLRRRRKPRR